MDKPVAQAKADGKKEMMEKKQCIEITDRALSMSEISLLLHEYDDIFSDFDPRSYSQKALSEDFLSELKRASIDKADGPLEIRFMMPADRRNLERENIIRKRLRSHFKRHHDIIKKEHKKLRRYGITLAALGVILIIIDSYIYPFKDTDFLSRVAFLALEPTGWFVTWTGLERFFYGPEKMKAEKEFYRKMMTCEIRFFGY